MGIQYEAVYVRSDGVVTWELHTDMKIANSYENCKCPRRNHTPKSENCNLIWKLQTDMKIARIKWPNTLPRDLCILKCHHHFFYCYFTPLLFSCWNIPLFLLSKYSPILAVTNHCLHNTPPGYFICYFTLTKSKTIFKHVPQLLRSYWIFSPIPPIHIGIFNHVPSS